MNPLPWRKASTILSIIIQYTNIERILPKKKSKVIQVFVFVLDLMKLKLWELQNETQFIDLDNSLCGIWSYCRIQLQQVHVWIHLVKTDCLQHQLTTFLNVLTYGTFYSLRALYNTH
ncbi:Hypothetical_protein [Hexamita inflata]|uniref:Hypothetical_protein n=1 Tax=Hexamita inflata TaxID=28002 RepID=A0AA86R3R5_9EUKA|nr:Hypothetical protein HINF_LOCUS56427 [Hexamita inflata]